MISKLLLIKNNKDFSFISLITQETTGTQQTGASSLEGKKEGQINLQQERALDVNCQREIPYWEAWAMNGYLRNV